MSIIHQALKKAAAEGQISPVPSTILRGHPARPFLIRSRVLIPLLALIFLISFIFSAKRIWPPFNLFLSSIDSALNVRSSPSPESKIPRLSVKQPPQKSFSLEPRVSAIPSNGKEGEAAIAEGLNFYNQGKMDLARQRFAIAASLLPFSAVAHNNLGLTLRNQGNVHEAMEHYQEAIRLDPDYAEAHNNLGMAYDQLGSIDRAASYYQKAIHFKPAVPEFHLNYATWLERKGDFIKASQEYQLYLSLESRTQPEGMTNRQQESVALVKARLKELKGL